VFFLGILFDMAVSRGCMCHVELHKECGPSLRVSDSYVKFSFLDPIPNVTVLGNNDLVLCVMSYR